VVAGPGPGDDLADFLAGRPELMIPGPGPLTEEALAILGSPLLAHYGGPWPALHAEVVRAVGGVMRCRDPFVLPGTGTMALDAALFNVFEPGQRVVVPATGYFGDRLADMARAHGLDVAEVAVPVGAPVDVDDVAAALVGADGLLAVHVETSTGVRHPVEALAGAASAAGAAVLVDAIASAGGEELDVEGWGVDAAVTASQKGLDGPPGLGVVALSERGRERVLGRDGPCPSWYLDLRRWEHHRADDRWEPHPVTMPTTAMLALLAGARRILAGGLGPWVARRAALAERCREGLAAIGYPPVPEPGCGANLVVAAWCDDPDAVAGTVAERAGLTIGRGLGATAGRAIRVGLLGATATDQHVDRLLAALA
jgi:alanine-glyoxylate transaminase / serine-glyoxylate transaminase / serine-pyruvate transaminase